MELKQRNVYKGKETKELLIVPYGIETMVGGHRPRLLTLLIVPYGIETYFR